MGGDNRPLLQGLLGELVHLRRAGAVTGEEERQQAVDFGVVRDVIGRKVEVGRDRLAPLHRPRPVLAEQGPLLRQLPGVAQREAHAVTGAEKDRGHVVATEQPAEPGLLRIVSENGFHLPVGLVAGNRGRERLDQVIGAELGGRVRGVAYSEERGTARQPAFAGFGIDYALGVSGIVFELVEVDAAHGVLHVHLVLEAIGDRFRVADEKKVVGRLVRVGGFGAGTVTGQELLLRLAGAVGFGAGVFLVVTLVRLRRLLLPVLQQGGERLLDLRVRACGEDDSPAGFGEVGGVDPFRCWRVCGS